MSTKTSISYRGKYVAFLTQHGKQDLLQRRFADALGAELVHTTGYDTDLLGAFTGETSRRGAQLDAARAKASMGMHLTRLKLGLASEGSFGPDPFVGFSPWNTEILLWVDEALGIEVQGFAHGPALNLQRSVANLEELKLFAQEAGFPSHFLVVRAEASNVPTLHKGLHDFPSLVSAFKAAQAESDAGFVCVENDLRAFANPTRQAVICKAAEDLIQKLQTHCPHCGMPGYRLIRHIPGLPCRVCDKETLVPLKEVWGCGACDFEAQKRINHLEKSSPAQCGHCNP